MRVCLCVLEDQVREIIVEHDLAENVFMNTTFKSFFASGGISVVEQQHIIWWN